MWVHALKCQLLLLAPAVVMKQECVLATVGRWRTGRRSEGGWSRRAEHSVPAGHKGEGCQRPHSSGLTHTVHARHIHSPLFTLTPPLLPPSALSVSFLFSVLFLFFLSFFYLFFFKLSYVSFLILWFLLSSQRVCLLFWILPLSFSMHSPSSLYMFVCTV